MSVITLIRGERENPTLFVYPSRQLPLCLFDEIYKRKYSRRCLATVFFLFHAFCRNACLQMYECGTLVLLNVWIFSWQSDWICLRIRTLPNLGKAATLFERLENLGLTRFKLDLEVNTAKFTLFLDKKTWVLLHNWVK